MSRSSPSPRPRILPSTTASPILSPTGPPCTKSSCPTESNQASMVLSRLTSRTKARSTQNTPVSEPGTPDYFTKKPYGFPRSNTVLGLQEIKESAYVSAYVSFPEFDQYQRRDAITANGQ